MANEITSAAAAAYLVVEDGHCEDGNQIGHDKNYNIVAAGNVFRSASVSLCSLSAE